MNTNFGGGGCGATACFPIFDVAAGSQVAFQFMQIQPANATAGVDCVVVHGNGHTNVSINGIFMNGYNEGTREVAAGIHADGFMEGDLLDIIYADGDILATGNEGTILVGFHLAGQVVLKPSATQLAAYAAAADDDDDDDDDAAGMSTAVAAGKGLFGELMRFTCCAKDFTTKITGGQTYVVENLYQESAVNYMHVIGVPGAPRGNIAVSAIKTYTTSPTQSVVDGWDGLWMLTAGGWNYQGMTETRYQDVINGARPRLLLPRSRLVRCTSLRLLHATALRACPIHACVVCCRHRANGRSVPADPTECVSPRR